MSLFSHWKQDSLAGLTAAVVALPLALAFGVQSGLGAASGLYGAIFLGFFAALLGGTKTQISGPTGPMTVITTLVVANAIAMAGSLNEAMTMIIATFLLAGLFQIALGFCRVGGYIRYIPYPVLSGFMTGIGLIIILLQIAPLLGQNTNADTLHVIMQLPQLITHINMSALFLSISTLIIYAISKRFIKHFPATLVALIVMTVATYILALPVPLIDTVPQGFPALQWNAITLINFSMLANIIFPAATLAALGAIDSLLTSIVVDNITKTKHNSNQELFGQGIGNAIAGLFGGIPGAGATMRTMANLSAGGKDRLSGMVHSVILLIILVFAGQLAEKIPLSVLAAILLTVGYNIIDFKGLKHTLNVPLSDSVVMILVIALTVFVNILYAVGIGLILSSLLFMKKMGDIAEEKTQLNYLQDISEKIQHEDESEIQATFQKKVFVKHLYGPLFFGFTSQFQQLIQTIPDVKLVILRMDHVPYIDQSGLYAIEDAVLYLETRGIQVILSGIQPQPLDMLQRINLIPSLIEESDVFHHFEDAFEGAKKIIQSQE